MSQNELTAKIREYRELQALIEEAAAEQEAIKDAIKAHFMLFFAVVVHPLVGKVLKFCVGVKKLSGLYTLVKQHGLTL